MKYFNRDLSWLAFNHRVLQEAQDRSVPLFERIKFLAIFSSNLEEFFRVRVAFLRSLLTLKNKDIKDLDFKVEDLLNSIHKKVNILQEQFGHTYVKLILPELEKNNIFIRYESEINQEQSNYIREYFLEKIIVAC